ncbi:MAG: glycosyltransferase family A protein, partial [Hyphomicrobiales bacterium]|nr:glycosyltransferase family A protein [Hyphomicrobiales bacterium]
MTPEISVILATHNRAELLARALHSIAQQTHQNWELIVVDDGSSDTTPDLLKAHAAKEPRLRIVRQKNAGPAAARNAGIQAATADLIALQDDDDMSPPHRLETCAAAMRAHPQWDALEHAFLFCDRKGKPSRRSGRRIRLFFRRALWQRIGGYRPFFRSQEDLDFQMRAEEAGVQVGALNEPLYYLVSSRQEGEAAVSHVGTAQHAQKYWLIAKACAAMRRAGLPDPVARGESFDAIMAMLTRQNQRLEQDFWQRTILPIFVQS